MLTALLQDHAAPARGKLQFGVFVALSHISVIAQNFKFPVPHTGAGGDLTHGARGGFHMLARTMHGTSDNSPKFAFLFGTLT